VSEPGARVRRWPLFLIASPAAVAIWSGWVGLGGLCGFGPIHPLPGIADGFTINTAITLPIGVEAYGAYALRAWLTPGAPDRAQQFAKRSALGALALGMCGQVIYHLLAAAHAIRAPWPVVMVVSCIPVITLGFGAALTHLLRPEGEGSVRDQQDRTEVPDRTEEPVSAEPEPTADPVHTETDRTGLAASREAVVASLAEEIRDAIEAGERWHPDYPALMERTGRRRSWCEKAVRDARTALLDSPDSRTEPARTDEDPAGARTDELVLTGAP
jgi:hypothetical protein